MFPTLARVPDQAQVQLSMKHERQAAEMRVSLKRQIRQRFMADDRPPPSLVGWTFEELLDLDMMLAR